ncbi:uncharacterized protein AAGF69_015038 isoform 1-T2 [Amazona ochrocephala]
MEPPEPRSAAPPIIGAEDEDFAQDMEPGPRDPDGLFRDVAALRMRPVPLLAFLHHVVTQLEPAPVLCSLHSELLLGMGPRRGGNNSWNSGTSSWRKERSCGCPSPHSSSLSWSGSVPRPFPSRCSAASCGSCGRAGTGSGAAAARLPGQAAAGDDAGEAELAAMAALPVDAGMRLQRERELLRRCWSGCRTCI